MDAQELSRKTAIVEKALKAIKNKLKVEVVLENVNGNIWYDQSAIEVKIKYKSKNNPNWIPLDYAFSWYWWSQELWAYNFEHSTLKTLHLDEIEKLVPSKKLSYMNDNQLATLRIAAFYYTEFAKRKLVNLDK